MARAGDSLTQLAPARHWPKREVYARCGTSELWLIDPDKRELAVYFLREDAERPARLVTEKESFTSALLPGLEISLGKILTR